ncbi:hypothetical protein [Candidatus Viridilinea mediisalina]|uniref:SD-repeat containing protein B domain-containing protein n=1 Tax=Candidatus Viridilinea mediisalina TaxID=2024553 RepID=A0A2A6RI85_9CHLR|nr:hypothetical protein [Candidatus Viridilinea mediisalina]PDW02595.1 hypothetical protein CJ255_13170 [Candidatus Viridilinea mediisalina]
MTMHRTIRPLTTLLALLLLLALSLVVLMPPAVEAQHYDDRIWGVVWHDLNCDGIRQDDEPTLTHVPLFLYYAGPDGEVHRQAPDIQTAYSSSFDGTYGFTLGGWGRAYFIGIPNWERPEGFYPAPFRQGDDPTRDNDLTVGLMPGSDMWTTPVFWMPPWEDQHVVTGIDIGLCSIETQTVYLPLVVR